LRGKKKYPIVVKTPKGLLGEPYYSCTVCGKMFRDEGSLKDHFNAQRKNDLEHKMFLNNKLTFRNRNKTMNNSNDNSNKFQHKPKFGRINIKTSKDE
jgi:transposase-like protein